MNKHSTIYPPIQSLLYAFLGSRSSKCDVPSIQTTVRVRAHHALNPHVVCSCSTLMRNENQCHTNPFACGKEICIGVGPSFAQFCFWLVIIVAGFLTVESTNARSYSTPFVFYVSIVRVHYPANIIMLWLVGTRERLQANVSKGGRTLPAFALHAYFVCSPFFEGEAAIERLLRTIVSIVGGTLTPKPKPPAHCHLAHTCLRHSDHQSYLLATSFSTSALCPCKCLGGCACSFINNRATHALVARQA